MRNAIKDLGFWNGRSFEEGYGFGPFCGNGIALLHGQASVVGKHLGAFAAAPGEKTQEMFLAHALRTGRSVDSPPATLDQTVQFIHSISMQERGSDFQPPRPCEA